jgi:ectoine hydroxylase
MRDGHRLTYESRAPKGPDDGEKIMDPPATAIRKRVMPTQSAAAGVIGLRPRLGVDDVVSRLRAHGFALIPGLLCAAEVRRLRTAADELVAQFHPTNEAPSQAVHLLGAAFAHPGFTDLATDQRMLPVLGTVLTPNIHLYHSHLDVHPPEAPTSEAWRWHEDGGRMTADMEVRARLSIKIGYWLSDVEAPGYGNLELIPGSHLWDQPLPRTAGTHPPGAIPVLARAGDAILFDRRIWHARGTNISPRTRRVVFFAYTPRWIAQRETPPTGLLEHEPSALRRQLLGSSEWDTCHVARNTLPVAIALARPHAPAA